MKASLRDVIYGLGLRVSSLGIRVQSLISFETGYTMGDYTGGYHRLRGYQEVGLELIFVSFTSAPPRR